MVENIGKYGLFRSGEIAFGEVLYTSRQKDSRLQLFLEFNSL